MPDAIRSTIDAAGRLVIPKLIRDAAGLVPGRPLEIRLNDGRIEIEPTPIEVRIENQRGVAVAVASESVPRATAEDVEAVRRQLRDEREARAR